MKRKTQPKTRMSSQGISNSQNNLENAEESEDLHLLTSKFIIKPQLVKQCGTRIKRDIQTNGTEYRLQK